MWDMTISGVVPGLHLAAPRDGQQVARAVRAAVDISDAPSVVRFPKGSVGAPIEAVRTVGTVDVLAEPDEAGQSTCSSSGWVHGGHRDGCG
jgi:1-deoxy-D-xylulose-5-phosphate synthase